MTEPAGYKQLRTNSEPKQAEATLSSSPPSADNLFDLYQRVVENRPGTRDAEIFEKIREWTFSNFSKTAHEFAGITKTELDSWQKRNRINLSAGHIRPDPIDLERGFAWGQIRLASAANRLHAKDGPPSAQEIKLARQPSGTTSNLSHLQSAQHIPVLDLNTTLDLKPAA